MIYGIMSDTHNCDRERIRKTIDEEFIPRGVEVIAFAGDIEIKHADRELFRRLPTLCVMTKEQAFDSNFCYAPEHWRYVRPAYSENPPSIAGNFSDPEAVKKLAELQEYCEKVRIFSRIVSFADETIYLGHERSDDFFNNFGKVRKFFTLINQIRDGVRLAITGHKHHQFLLRTNNFTWINPGALDHSWNGTEEFAVYDSVKDEVVFGRLSSQESRLNPVSVGILSDTLNVDDLDASYWLRCRENFDRRGVTHVICCGNFLSRDIGHRELDGLQVYCYLLSNDSMPQSIPENWHIIRHSNPVVEIGGHRFYVQHEIGSEQGSLSEVQRDAVLKDIRARYPHLDFIIAGLGPETVYMEGQDYSFINPGNARDHKRFAVVCLPRREYTFGSAM